MTGEHVLYLGRMVPKAGFRTYIYGSGGLSTLVNSWQEFQDYIATGVWFDTVEKAQDKGIKKKGKS